MVELNDLTIWHEFWINIVADTSGGGTHKVTIWKDGDVDNPEEHHVTTSTSFEDFHGTAAYLALGMPTTSLDGAFDVDFYAVKGGLFSPAATDQIGVISEQPGWWNKTVVLEGGFTDTLEVVLNSEPDEDVTVTLDPNTAEINLGEGYGNPKLLTFTAGNWDTAVTVTVTGVNDDAADGDVMYSVVTAAAIYP